MEYFNELKNLLASVETDVDQFFNKNNRLAGTRVRRAMLGVKALAQAIRRQITELINQTGKQKD